MVKFNSKLYMYWAATRLQYCLVTTLKLLSFESVFPKIPKCYNLNCFKVENPLKTSCLLEEDTWGTYLTLWFILIPIRITEFVISQQLLLQGFHKCVTILVSRTKIQSRLQICLHKTFVGHS